mmetsp:Transcript_40244/g.96397  ORF Transcript_40244/g.96397 Transcript_40244/m.96397 type:complete len:389 (+) Transcript_40244:221-1387(+)
MHTPSASANRPAQATTGASFSLAACLSPLAAPHLRLPSAAGEGGEMRGELRGLDRVEHLSDDELELVLVERRADGGEEGFHLVEGELAVLVGVHVLQVGEHLGLVRALLDAHLVEQGHVDGAVLVLGEEVEERLELLRAAIAQRRLRLRLLLHPLHCGRHCHREAGGDGGCLAGELEHLAHHGDEGRVVQLAADRLEEVRHLDERDEVVAVGVHIVELLEHVRLVRPEAHRGRAHLESVDAPLALVVPRLEERLHLLQPVACQRRRGCRRFYLGRRLGRQPCAADEGDHLLCRGLHLLHDEIELVGVEGARGGGEPQEPLRLGDEAVVVDVHVLELGEDLRLVRAHLGHRPCEGRELELARSVDVPSGEELLDAGALACVQSDLHLSG